MRLLIVILFFLSVLNGRAQILIKGSAIILEIDYHILSSSTIGTELKVKRWAVEYFFNHVSLPSDASYWSNTNQLSLKYYFINKPDSLRSFKWYVSPFVSYKYMVKHGDYESPQRGLIQKAKGLGTGFLVGITRDFSKHFGYEPGLYCYYLSTNKGQNRPGDFVFQQLESGFNYGVRIYIYLKFNKS